MIHYFNSNSFYNKYIEKYKLFFDENYCNYKGKTLERYNRLLDIEKKIKGGIQNSNQIFILESKNTSQIVKESMNIFTEQEMFLKMFSFYHT